MPHIEDMPLLEPREVVKLGSFEFGAVVRPEEAMLAAENSRLRGELADALNRLARLRAGGRG